MPSTAGRPGNEILNVNADEAAAAIAIAGKADLLVFMTEAGGILDRDMAGTGDTGARRGGE